MVESTKFPPPHSQEALQFPVFVPLDVGRGDVARQGGGAELVVLERRGSLDTTYGSGVVSGDTGGRLRISQLCSVTGDA